MGEERTWAVVVYWLAGVEYTNWKRPGRTLRRSLF